jgi:hypothetical protein
MIVGSDAVRDDVRLSLEILFFIHCKGPFVSIFGFRPLSVNEFTDFVQNVYYVNAT